MATFEQARAAKSKAYVKRADKALFNTPCPWCGELQTELELSDCALCWRINDLSDSIVACNLVKAAIFSIKMEKEHGTNYATKPPPSPDEEGLRYRGK